MTTNEDEFTIKPDPRMVHFTGGFDSAGSPIPISPAGLRRKAEQWPRTDATPPEVAGLLKTSRDLFVHGYFVYEFLTVGVLLSLQAAETSLRLALGSKQQFEHLIDRAHSDGLFENETRDRLHAGRKLRNGFSHPDQQAVWTFGMVVPIIAGSHDLIAGLFPEEPRSTPRAYAD